MKNKVKPEKESKGFETMDLNEFMSEDFDMAPHKGKISYAVDDKYFTLIETLKNGRSREVYHISRERCKTIEQQLDWLLQLSQKTWVDSYRFAKEFAMVLRLWKHTTMETICTHISTLEPKSQGVKKEDIKKCLNK